MNTNDKKDYSISLVRFVAMVFIVACHMMQRDDFATEIYGARIGWAWWFNVGVQMFLFISGYLYGKKSKIDAIKFYKKAFPKLLVDYYIFVIAMLVIIRFSPLMGVDYNGVIGLLTFSNQIPGLGHLWFIPVILFCYLLTPILSEIINAIDMRSNTRFWIEALLLLFVIHFVLKRLFGSFNSPWINCFVIGMLYSRLESRGGLMPRIFTCISILLCVIIIPIQFRIDYWPHSELSPMFSNSYGYFCDYGHVFLGVTLVLCFRSIYKIFDDKMVKHSILDWSDKYSYDVYLVHHVFVQSAFACVEFIARRWISLPLAVVLTIIFSMILFSVSSFVRNKSIEMFRKLPN